jgi:Arm DNA-binding domain
MAEGRITKRVVDGLKPDGRDFVKWDSELTGFGARVRPSGAKSFVAVYRTGGRNSPLRKVTIGAVSKSKRLVKPHARSSPVPNSGKIMRLNVQRHARN